MQSVRDRGRFFQGGVVLVNVFTPPPPFQEILYTAPACSYTSEETETLEYNINKNQ